MKNAHIAILALISLLVACNKGSGLTLIDPIEKRNEQSEINFENAITNALKAKTVDAVEVNYALSKETTFSNEISDEKVDEITETTVLIKTLSKKISKELAQDTSSTNRKILIILGLEKEIYLQNDELPLKSLLELILNNLTSRSGARLSYNQELFLFQLINSVKMDFDIQGPSTEKTFFDLDLIAKYIDKRINSDGDLNETSLLKYAFATTYFPEGSGELYNVFINLLTNVRVTHKLSPSENDILASVLLYVSNSKNFIEVNEFTTKNLETLTFNFNSSFLSNIKKMLEGTSSSVTFPRMNLFLNYMSEKSPIAMAMSGQSIGDYKLFYDEFWTTSIREMNQVFFANINTFKRSTYFVNIVPNSSLMSTLFTNIKALDGHTISSYVPIKPGKYARHNQKLVVLNFINAISDVASREILTLLKLDDLSFLLELDRLNAETSTTNEHLSYTRKFNLSLKYQSLIRAIYNVVKNDQNQMQLSATKISYLQDHIYSLVSEVSKIKNVLEGAKELAITEKENYQFVKQGAYVVTNLVSDKRIIFHPLSVVIFENNESVINVNAIEGGVFSSTPSVASGYKINGELKFGSRFSQAWTRGSCDHGRRRDGRDHCYHNSTWTMIGGERPSQSHEGTSGTDALNLTISMNKLELSANPIFLANGGQGARGEISIKSPNCDDQNNYYAGMFRSGSAHYLDDDSQAAAGSPPFYHPDADYWGVPQNIPGHVKSGISGNGGVGGNGGNLKFITKDDLIKDTAIAITSYGGGGKPGPLHVCKGPVDISEEKDYFGKIGPHGEKSGAVEFVAN